MKINWKKIWNEFENWWNWWNGSWERQKYKIQHLVPVDVDWDKLWNEFDKWHDSKKDYADWETQSKMIQKLVNKFRRRKK